MAHGVRRRAHGHPLLPAGRPASGERALRVSFVRQLPHPGLGLSGGQAGRAPATSSVSTRRRVKLSRWLVSVTTRCATHSEILPVLSRSRQPGSSNHMARASPSRRTPSAGPVLQARAIWSAMPRPSRRGWTPAAPCAWIWDCRTVPTKEGLVRRNQTNASARALHGSLVAKRLLDPLGVAGILRVGDHVRHGGQQPVEPVRDRVAKRDLGRQRESCGHGSNARPAH